MNELLYQTIIHETKNSFTILKNSMKILETRHPDLGSDNRWRDMREELTDMLSLFQDAAYLKEDISITKRAHSLPDFLNECIRKCGIDQTYQNIHILRRYQPDFPAVFFDGHSLSHAVTNLLKNAAEAILACPEYRAGTQTGIITVQASFDETNVILHIADNGCGIPMQHQAPAITPFQSTKEGGTGLGLVITERILNAHDGSLQLLPLKQGTDVRIIFPIHP